MGRPGFDEPGRSRREGEIYSAPEVLETTKRYNENDGVRKRVHELAFGIVICFDHGSRYRDDLRCDALDPGSNPALGKNQC